MALTVARRTGSAAGVHKRGSFQLATAVGPYGQEPALDGDYPHDPGLQPGSRPGLGQQVPYGGFQGDGVIEGGVGVSRERQIVVEDVPIAASETARRRRKPWPLQPSSSGGYCA